MTVSARLRVRDVALDKLHPNDGNPRTIKDERLRALMRSIEAEPGMLDARPVVALKDGTIIAGNMRWRACKELGRETIPCVRVDLDDERAKLWLLRDNQEYGEWEDDALARLLEELTAAGANLDLSGFDAAAIDELLRSLDPVPVVDQGAKLAALKVSIADPVHEVATGDVWSLLEPGAPPVIDRHVLVVTSVYTDWQVWGPLLRASLGEAVLFVPYPSPIVPLTERARQNRLVMVQPDPWLAGHLLDKYAEVYGQESVRRISTKRGS